MVECIRVYGRGQTYKFTATKLREAKTFQSIYPLFLCDGVLFFRHYRMPREGEVPQMLSATDIYEHLHRTNARLMDKVSAYRFGAILRAMGVTRHQCHDRRVYAVVPLDES